MAVVMLAIFVIMVVIAWDYPPQSRFLPLVIGIPGIVLTLVQLCFDVQRDVRAPRPSPTSRTRASGSHQGASQLHWELVLFGYFVGLVAGVPLFGFWLTVPVFLIVFLRLHERENKMFVISLTAASWFATYLIFDQLLGVELHAGFLAEYVRR